VPKLIRASLTRTANASLCGGESAREINYNGVEGIQKLLPVLEGEERPSSSRSTLSFNRGVDGSSNKEGQAKVKTARVFAAKIVVGSLAVTEKVLRAGHTEISGSSPTHRSAVRSVAD